MDELSSDRRLIAPRHPGFGRSTGLEHLDDIVDLAIYYLDFLDALALDSVDLIGESFGGMLAAEVAALAPQRIRHLALIAPHGLWIDNVPTLDVFGVPASDLHRLSWADPDCPIAQKFAPNAGTDDEQWRAWIERMRSLAAAGKFMWPIADKGLRKRIHRISAPTLLLWGEKDQVIPTAYGKLFQEKVAGSELALVPNAGHFPLIEQPGEAIPILKRFFSA
jgi:pimeloyl-ACP methyl ester carboxylesterase